MKNNATAVKMRQIVIFVITDSVGFVWGVAPSKVQARKQIAWFLPRGYNYRVEPQIAYTT